MESFYEIPMKIVLTGFKPFLGDLVNPSEVICENISLDNFFSHVITQVLPVDFNQAFLELKKTVEKEKPDYVIMMGLASSRQEISLEKVALNWNESNRPDESGNFVKTSPINAAHTELAIMTSFPINDLQEYLEQKKYPVKMSFSAGTYVCNNVYYKMLREFPNIKSLFVHVPYFEHVSLETQIQVIQDLVNRIG